RPGRGRPARHRQHDFGGCRAAGIQVVGGHPLLVQLGNRALPRPAWAGVLPAAAERATRPAPGLRRRAVPAAGSACRDCIRRGLRLRRGLQARV
ncbi:hypothetical protein H4R21_004491, partial [Coemansia helicoidea]